MKNFFDLETNRMFSILKTSLFKHEYIHGDSIKWESVYQELSDQTVLSLTGKWLSKKYISQPLYDQWLLYVSKSVYQWNKSMSLQDDLSTVLDENNIPYVIMKGAAAAYYYPYPELRTMGDIDFYISSKDFEEADHILRECGYLLEDKAPHHWEYVKDGVSFEMHRFPSGMNQDDKVLSEFFDKGLSEAKEVTLGNYRFSIFPDLQNGLVLLLHILYHLESGLGLRQICDWMMFAASCLNDEYYYECFQPVLKQADIETLAITVTRMCQMYLGLTEEITWCKSADEQVCNSLMDCIMNYGNFGRKDDTDLHKEKIIATRITYYIKHPWTYFKHLQRDGKEKWTLLKKLPFLTPFAWLYRLFYSFIHLFSVIKRGDLKTQAGNAFKRQELFQRLGIQDRFYQ